MVKKRFPVPASSGDGLRFSEKRYDIGESGNMHKIIIARVREDSVDTTGRVLFCGPVYSNMHRS